MAKGYTETTDRTRRFWIEASVASGEGGFDVRLDARAARTPAGLPLRLPTAALAALVAAEWAAQGEYIEPSSMLATRLAATALDRVPAAHAAVAAEVARYAASDLLCYVAEGPEPLLQAEQAAWSPHLAWAQAELGLRFVQTAGIVHTPQPPETVDHVERLAAALDPFRLTGLAFVAPLLGSAVLALALERGRLTGLQAFEASRVDEAFQESRWGVDDDAAARAAQLLSETQLADRWFRALA